MSQLPASCCHRNSRTRLEHTPRSRNPGCRRKRRASVRSTTARHSVCFPRGPRFLEAKPRKLPRGWERGEELAQRWVRAGSPDALKGDFNQWRSAICTVVSVTGKIGVSILGSPTPVFK